MQPLCDHSLENQVTRVLPCFFFCYNEDLDYAKTVARKQAINVWCYAGLKKNGLDRRPELSGRQADPIIRALSKVIEILSSKTTELPVAQANFSAPQSSTLDQLKKSIDPRNFSVIKLPSKIWVFGGKKNLGNANDSLSLRDSFLKKALTPEAQTPENHCQWFKFFDYPENYATDWWAFSGYSDLLEFEHDACYLARAIILFVESPGALAEFGALAINPYLAARVFIVVEAQHQDETQLISFINLGPIKRIVNKNGHLCIIDESVNRVISVNDFSELMKSFNDWTTSPSKAIVFNKDDPTHQMLLISDLIDLFLIAKSGDILSALEFLGVNITIEILLKFCNLLKFLGFIKIEKRASEVFFLRSKESDAPWISYKSLPDVGFNRQNFKIRYSREWVEKNVRLKSVYERIYGRI